MDWTFWALSLAALLAVGVIGWMAYRAFFDGWDDHMDEWCDE